MGRLRSPFLFSVTLIGKDIHKAANLLQKGFVVGIPTETVYGLAANALNEDAVVSVFEIKKRPFFDPLIIHVGSWEEALRYVKNVPPVLEQLALQCMPGPLTLLLEKKANIPDLVTSGSEKVAVRIPSHPMTRSLLSLLDFPLAAPSANPFGYISPTTAKHVEDQLGREIPYILDGGPSEVGLESTIIGMENDELTIFRKGGLEVETIGRLAGQKVAVKEHSNSQPLAPGMLTSHYAPKIPFVCLEFANDWESIKASDRIAYLRFTGYFPGAPQKNHKILSVSGDLHEEARNIVSGMHTVDELDIDLIYAEKLPETGLGLAINDRMKRASAKS